MVGHFTNWLGLCSGTMLTKGEDYTDQGQDYYEARYRQMHHLSQRAEKLGMKLVANEQVAKFLFLINWLMCFS